MTRRMLINAQSSELVRVAIASGSTLDEFQIESAETGATRGNIYRGVIVNIEPSLNAAFIDYGPERHGFLAIQDVVPEAYYHQPPAGKRPRIEDVLQKGRSIVVQVTREAEGTKGAVLTTDLSLPGRYLVLTPFDPTRGISRKVENDEDRKRLRELTGNLKVPEGCGFIVRTNALDQNKTALSKDLAALLRLWKQVALEARQGKGTKLLHSDQDLILKALRDYLDSSVEEVLIDDDDAFDKAQGYLRAFMPRGKTLLTRYTERTPLFATLDLEPQIERIYDRTVPLPSGGSLSIDPTEALTSVDVNSGRSTGAGSQEETALHTNLEAAREVARQLRLRDIGGLVVVDFIDMRSRKNQRRLEKALRDEMKTDKARSSVSRISSNGLVEINRQRLQQAISQRTHRPCPTCAGTGRIASPEMVGLALLRRIEARASSGRPTPIEGVKLGLHPEIAEAFQNHRRQEIAALEREFGIRVEVTAATYLDRPDQKVEWLERRGGASTGASTTASAAVSTTRRASAGPRKASSARPARPAAAGSASSDKAADEKPAASRPRRRRRRRKKPASEGQSAKPQEAAAGPKAPKPRSKSADSGKPPAPEQGNSGPQAASEPKKRRPRRRRPRKGSGGESTAPAEATASS